MDVRELHLLKYIFANHAHPTNARKIYKEKAKEEALLATEALKALRKREYEVFTERNSSFVSQASTSVYTDNDPPDVYGNDTTDLPTPTGLTVPFSLAEFLRRPVLIHAFNIAVGDESFLNVFEPWLLWSSNPTVRTRLINSAFFSGTLCLKFTLSSSKYYYGSILVSNQPFPKQNKVLQVLEEIKVLAGDNIRPTRCFNVYTSQSPETCVMMIGSDTTAELKLPMLSPKGRLRLGNRDGLLIQNINEFEEFEALSSIYVTPMTALRNIRSSTEPITCQVMAWIEDLDLVGITTTDISITPEGDMDAYVDAAKGMRDNIKNHPVVQSISQSLASKADDEYSPKHNPVATIASAVSNEASKLSSVPILGEAAKATSIAASGAARVFKFLGMSKPADITDPSKTYVVTGDNWTHAMGSSSAVKMTLDPKQELSIHALGGDSTVDPMSIKNICARESFLDGFEWTAEDQPLTANLAVIPVTPELFNRVIVTSDARYRTPMGWLASMFKYWRGTIDFRFQIVASEFHRGKLIISYEPMVDDSILWFSKKTNTNLERTIVIDIEREREFTIKVGYERDRAFCSTQGSNLTGNRLNGASENTIKSYNGVEGCLNGYLIVRPLVPLTDPTGSDAPVDLNLFVRSTDMDFAGYNNEIEEASYVVSQSSPEVIDSSKVSIKDGDYSTQSTIHVLNGQTSQQKNVFLYHFGERIESLRYLLKRTFVNSFYRSIIASGNFASYQINDSMYPCLKSNKVPKIPSLADTTQNYSPSNVQNSDISHLLGHLRLGFLFMRGGFRHRFVLNEIGDGNGIEDVTVLAYSRASFNPGLIPTLSPAPIGFSPFKTGTFAEQHFDTKQNNLVEFEIPYYSGNLFSHTLNHAVDNPVDEVTANGIFLEDSPKFQLTAVSEAGFVGNSDRVIYVTHYASAADDFSLLRFQGAPYIRL